MIRSIDSPLKVAYVVSMAMGLQSFVYREVRELLSLGVIVHLFPTKAGSGPYLPDADWPVHRPTVRSIGMAHFRLFIADSQTYLEVLFEALRRGALVDFLLAALVSMKVRQEGLRLIHCHFGDHKFFVGYFSGRLTGCPVSVTIHAYELYNNPNPGLFRKAIKLVKGIVTVAEYNRDILQTYGVPPGKIHVVPMFADLPNVSISANSIQAKIRVLMVARFVEKKGHRTFLRALSRLPEEYEAWLVGSGSLDVAALADSLGVAHRVKILGRLSDPDLQAAYRGATMFCLPSETTSSGDREGIPVSLMEAMAYGLPVIATRHAGIPELVPEILVDEGDVDALARGIDKLGRNPVLREELGRRNREVAASRFSRDNVLRLKTLLEGWAT